MKSVNIEPTKDGYINIYKFVKQALLSDVKANRKKAAIALLESIEDLAIYLNSLDRKEYLKIKEASNR